MKVLKKNMKVVIAFILGVVLTGGAVFASKQYLASQVDYKNNKTVEDALDDLYGKIPSGTIPITTKGNQIDVENYKYADTTGLYTLDEVQSGKGTSWNYGDFTTEDTGTKQINLGFRPTEMYFEGYDSAGVLYLFHYSNNNFYYIITAEPYSNGYINDMIEINENGFKTIDWGIGSSFSYIAR